MPEAIVFLPLPARRALQAIHRKYPGVHLEIERRGPIRRPVSATLHVESPVRLEVLSDGELSAELRARRDASLDPLAAVRVREDWAQRIAEATGGIVRSARPDPVLRGLALCALVGRLQTEEDEWEGREQEPQRLLRWLGGSRSRLRVGELGVGPPRNRRSGLRLAIDRLFGQYEGRCDELEWQLQILQYDRFAADIDVLGFFHSRSTEKRELSIRCRA